MLLVKVAISLQGELDKVFLKDLLLVLPINTYQLSY